MEKPLKSKEWLMMWLKERQEEWRFMGTGEKNMNVSFPIAGGEGGWVLGDKTAINWETLGLKARMQVLPEKSEVGWERSRREHWKWELLSSVMWPAMCKGHLKRGDEDPCVVEVMTMPQQRSSRVCGFVDRIFFSSADAWINRSFLGCVSSVERQSGKVLKMMSGVTEVTCNVLFKLSGVYKSPELLVNRQMLI